MGERPESDVIDAIDDTLDECDRLQRRRDELLATIPETLARLKPLKNTDREAFNREVWWLYWHCKEIGARQFWDTLFDGKMNSKEWQDAIAGCAEVQCSRCGVVFRKRIHSRSGFSELRSKAARGDAPMCDACKREAERERQEAYRREAEYRTERLEELRAMSYQQYLQTPEWQEKREAKLANARFRCQLCNAGSVVLNVHHRTYRTRGREPFSDLIVLCRDCHAKHHDKVVGQ